MTTDHTPVLVGAGVVMQRHPDPVAAKEPLALMEDALRAAGADCGVPDLLKRLDAILVPHGRWRYSDPGRVLAQRVGAPDARTTLAHIGILQTTLLGRACARIAAGEIAVAAVVGGEAGDRVRAARKAGVRFSNTVIEDPADEIMKAEHELFHPAEHAVGLKEAVDFYALLECAFRSSTGLTVDEGRDEIASLYSRFSEIGADNPHAWRPQTMAANEIRDASPKNPMIAFPYARAHVTSWSVDQAGALLLCSAGVARELGVPADRWIFPLVNAESNFMLELCRRPELHRCPGAEIAGARAFDHAGFGADDLDLVELYSCFPVAVQMYAQELGIDRNRDLTITGGMPFAGGPLNNYAIQAMCRMAELLRADSGARHGLVTAVSGLLTKQGITVWSTEPGPAPFADLDVGAEVAQRTAPRDATENFTGAGAVVASTVLYSHTPPRAVALVEDADGVRGFGWSDDAELAARFETEDWVGRTVYVTNSVLQGDSRRTP